MVGTDPCCDADGYLPASTVCGWETEQKFGCPWGDQCGSASAARYGNRYCSGGSVTCDGEIGDWGGWQTVWTCASWETCVPGSSACALDPACCRAGGFCDGECGPCPTGEYCGDDGLCLACLPSSCGRGCGACPAGQYCGVAGTCQDCSDTDCAQGCCPPLAGYTASCNAQGYCEYASDDQTGWRHWGALVWVPPSSFPMGAPDGEGEPEERPQHQVTFERGYWIHKYEVTTEAYGDFLVARGGLDESCMFESRGMACLHPDDAAGWTIDWDEGSGAAVIRSTCQATAGGPADWSCASHPVIAVSRPGAGEYCAWRGMRLCAEAEWERAAKGTTHRVYPWGDAPEPSCDLAVFDDGPPGMPWGCEPCTEAGCSGTQPVGSRLSGASYVGALDMAGNVAEWVADCLHDTYDGAPSDGTAWTTDCLDERQVQRGGQFRAEATSMHGAYRGTDGYPEFRSALTGARCASSLWRFTGMP